MPIGNVPKFMKTDVVNGHRHIVYMRKDGTGYTSIEQGHTHLVEYVLPEPEQNDPITGQVTAPAKEGFWRLAAQGDGHIHEFLDIEFKQSEIETKPGENADTRDLRIVGEVLSIFKSQRDHEHESRKEGEESEGFFHGRGQWEKSVKDGLTSRNRAALTINEIQSKVNLLSGFQRLFRTDINYLPVEGGDQRIADILTMIMKNIMDQNTVENEEIQVSQDQYIAGRGIFNVRADFDKDPRGEIVVERFPWKNLFAGPHEKLDMSDCDTITKARWYSLEQAIAIIPEKADEIEQVFEFDRQDGHDRKPEPHIRIRGQQYTISNNRIRVTTDKEVVDIVKKNVRVLEQWRKVHSKADSFVNPTDDFSVNVENWFPEDIEAVKTIPGFRIIKRNSFKMRVTVVIGNVLVSDEFPELPIQDFFIAPAYANKRDDNFWGIVEAMKDPQREVNKRHSQLVDIGNKMAAYGWFYRRRTFPNPEEKTKFLNTSSSAGFAIEIEGQPPDQVQGTKFPSELVQMEILASQKMREVSNLPELPTSVQSGKQVIEVRRTGLIGNEFLFDNINISKKKIGKLALPLIQQIYPPERIIRVIENQMRRGPIRIDGVQMQGAISPEDREAIREILENADLTRYDVKVTVSPTNPTIRRGIFEAWSDLAKQGLDVPMSILVEFSDFPEKDRILEMMQSQQQSNQQLEQGKQETEILKTAIKASTTRAGRGGNGVPVQPQTQIPITGR